MRTLLIASLFLVLSLSAKAQTVVTFDSPAPAGSSGSRMPVTFGGITWPQTANQAWAWESMWNAGTTNHVYFDTASGTSRAFTFVQPSVLQSLQVFGDATGTLIITDDVGQSVMFSVAATSHVYVVTTNWTKLSSKVTMTYAAGWHLGFDNITYKSSSGVLLAANVREAMTSRDVAIGVMIPIAPCGIPENLITTDFIYVVAKQPVKEFLVETSATNATTSTAVKRQTVTTLSFPADGVLSIVGNSVVFKTSAGSFVIAITAQPSGTQVSSSSVTVTEP